MRLMIVDDSNMIRTRISRVVQTAGFRELGRIGIVALAKDGVDAVRMFTATRPDIVTMDLTMPNMDGLACIKQLIALSPGVSILVVSALDDKSTAIAAIKAGARGFVAKPFTDEELQLALIDLMEGLA